MNNRQYVTRAAQLKGLSLIAPSRKAPGILATDWSTGFGRHVIDATTWSQAREQIDAYYRAQAK